ncbi:hypothetical protein T484DRAFT_1753455 [Baffinella frigidus]|nr:hypothetical protein T484DRAFT_1753455 [Cryptophyta sp. CCMP2293]
MLHPLGWRPKTEQTRSGWAKTGVNGTETDGPLRAVRNRATAKETIWKSMNHREGASTPHRTTHRSGLSKSFGGATTKPDTSEVLDGEKSRVKFAQWRTGIEADYGPISEFPDLIEQFAAKLLEGAKLARDVAEYDKKQLYGK